MNFEPLVPTGYIMGRLDVDNLPMEEMKTWCLENQHLKGNHAETMQSFADKRTCEVDVMLNPRDKKMRKLFDVVLNEIDSIIDKMSGGALVSEAFWTNVQHKGQSTTFHSHPNRVGPNAKDLSFVFYIQAEEGHGELVFPLEIDGVNYTKTIIPNTGGLVIFPSHLSHFTYQNRIDTPRILLSGNYREKEYIAAMEGQQIEN